MRCVWEVHQALPEVPLIGCGGIRRGSDVVEYLMAGASAVAMGTVHFAEPKAGRRIHGELARWCRRNGVEAVRRPYWHRSAMVSHNPILVALDTATAEQANQLAQQVAPSVGGFKVGLRLLLGPGPATISAVAGLGKPVFADAKLHDIPSQVEPAAARLGEFGARWVTAHTGGGRGMLEAAVAGLSRGAAAEAGILAVTVLTSWLTPT